MRNKSFCFVLMFLFCTAVFGQGKVGSTDPSVHPKSKLHIYGSNKDSTMFKYWQSELYKTQFQLAQLDSLKIKWTGIGEYQYNQLLQEAKKLQEVKK